MAPRKRDVLAPTITKTAPIERSFKGLRDALFDEFDNLRSNKAKPERANAAARLAGEITKSISVQCELLRVVTRDGDGNGREVESVKGLLK